MNSSPDKIICFEHSNQIKQYSILYCYLDFMLGAWIQSSTEHMIQFFFKIVNNNAYHNDDDGDDDSIGCLFTATINSTEQFSTSWRFMSIFCAFTRQMGIKVQLGTDNWVALKC